MEQQVPFLTLLRIVIQRGLQMSIYTTGQMNYGLVCVSFGKEWIVYAKPQDSFVGKVSEIECLPKIILNSTVFSFATFLLF